MSVHEKLLATFPESNIMGVSRAYIATGMGKQMSVLEEFIFCDFSWFGTITLYTPRLLIYIPKHIYTGNVEKINF